MSRAGAFKTIRSEPLRAGFTLLELVLALVLTGILAGLFGGLLRRPMEAQVDIGRRALLVDTASTALGRIARDVRAAVPNSLRVSPDGRVLELLRSADAAKYRSGPGINPGGADHTSATDWLEFAGDSSFNLLGRFTSLSYTPGVPLPAGTRLAIYTTDATTWSDAATGANPGVITPAGTQIRILDDGDEDQLSLSAPYSFRFASPRQRVYVVEGPVSYVCDPASPTLWRVDGYSPTAAQPTNVAANPLAAGRVAALATGVSGCGFAYDPGTATRAGLVTLDLALTQQTERARLLDQVHVEGAP